MKDKIIWIVIALFILVVLGVILIFTSKTVTIDSIKSMHFSYSSGYSIYAYSSYDVQKKDDGYYATVKPYGLAEEAAQEVKLDDAQVKEILSVLNKYEVSKWNGFHKSNKYVLDGDSFSFSLYIDNDKEISASGYMMYPNNYNSVEKELTSIFDSLYQYPDRVYE